MAYLGFALTPPPPPPARAQPDLDEWNEISRQDFADGAASLWSPWHSRNMPLTAALFEQPESFAHLKAIRARRLRLQRFCSTAWRPVFERAATEISEYTRNVTRVRARFGQRPFAGEGAIDRAAPLNVVMVCRELPQPVELSTFFLRAPESLVRYHEQTLRLLVALCEGYNDRSIALVRRAISLEQMVYILRCTKLPTALRTAYWELALCAHLPAPVPTASGGSGTAKHFFVAPDMELISPTVWALQYLDPGERTGRYAGRVSWGKLG